MTLRAITPHNNPTSLARSGHFNPLLALMRIMAKSQIYFLVAVTFGALVQLFVVRRYSYWHQVRDAAPRGTRDGLNLTLCVALLLVIPILMRPPWWRRAVALVCCVYPALFIREFVRWSS